MGIDIPLRLKKAASLPPLKETLVKAKKEDVLELDELWSFVQRKKNKRWVGLAQCRRTRQIVAYAIGDRSRKTRALLWSRVPKSYKKAGLYTDFWDAYKSGTPTRRSCPPSVIGRPTKARARPVTLSASTASCVSDWGASSGARFRSRRRTPCTRTVYVCFSRTTTDKRQQLELGHYP